MSKIIRLYDEIRKLNYAGVYIFSNKRLNTFYVGKCGNAIMDRVKNHIEGNTKKSVKELIDENDTHLYIGNVENSYSSAKLYDKELRTIEYAIFVYMTNNGWSSLNGIEGFYNDIREKYNNEKESIKVDKIINFKYNLFEAGFREVILNRKEYYESCNLKKEKERLIEENKELRNKINKSSVFINNKNRIKALKLYLNRIVQANKIDDLVLISGCDINKIMSSLKYGEVNSRLIDGINYLIKTDISVLLGERELSNFEECELESYYSEVDNGGTLKRVFTNFKKAEKLDVIVHLGGNSMIYDITSSINEGIIPRKIKLLFQYILKLKWKDIEKYNDEKLLVLIKDINYTKEYNEHISFVEILSKNNLVEQTSDILYSYKPDNKKNNFKFISDIISVKRFKLLKIYKYSEYSVFFRNVMEYKNYIIIHDYNNYRFCEVSYYYDDDGYNGKGYFILDYNDSIKCDNQEYAKYAYEINLDSFYYFTSRISAFENDLKIEVLYDKAKKDLSELNKTIELFIQFNKEKLKLIKSITLS